MSELQESEGIIANCEPLPHGRDGAGPLRGGPVMRRVTIVLGVLAAVCGCGFALGPALALPAKNLSHTVRRPDEEGRLPRGPRRES